MAISTTSHDARTRTSRRVLLAGALGGIGAWAASAIGRAGPVHATDGQPVVQGSDNVGSLSTLVRISSPSTAFQGLADAAFGETYGVLGRNSSTQGAGVFGVATSLSGTSAGVRGLTNSQLGRGVWGDNPSGAGVVGTSISGVGVIGTGQAGVGVAGASDSSAGVVGNSSSGVGVEGFSSANVAVHGNSPAGVGVRGTSGSGIGVDGTSNTNAGVNGTSPIVGVNGTSNSGVGVHGTSPAGVGVRGTSANRAVWGETADGQGIFGEATGSGFAGYFAGRVFTTAFHELTEIPMPAPPAADGARLFVRDNGMGRTQLCVLFHSGKVKVLATD